MTTLKGKRNGGEDSGFLSNVLARHRLRRIKHMGTFLSNDGRMAYGDEIYWAYHGHMPACTCSDGAVANTDHGLCGASKVVIPATDGPCGVAQ